MNDRAVAEIAQAEPVLAELTVARDAAGLKDGELGHAGPPFAPDEVLPPTVLNALAACAVIEGWAGDMDAGRRMIERREIVLRPNHGLGIVSPMSGVVRPSQPLMRLVDRAGGGQTFATFAEKGLKVLRFGFYDEAVVDGLRYVEGTVAPAIARALPKGGLPVWPLMHEAVTLGDDIHQRNIGGMYAFLKALPGLPDDVRTWCASNPQHFLNYCMAAAKLALDRARGIAGSSVVVAITRNGNRCAIQLAGTGDRWFGAPAAVPVGGFFPPFTVADAQPDLGDSAIMETLGFGGAIAHCSPEIARSMGRAWPEAVEAGRRQRSFFLQRNPHASPALAGEDGIGIGLCARRVAAGGEGLRIHTGIAHRDGKQGWIGVGVVTAPHACFEAAVAALV